MPIEWRDATVGGFGIFVAIAGGSTSGKTFTALRLAEGLKAPGTDTFVCDTEGGRTLHYAEQFRFKHFDMRAPFSPMRFLEIARDAESAGAGVLIFDNFTLEWIGEGGVHSAFDTYVAGRIDRARRGNDQRSDEQLRLANAQAGWAQVKPPHKAMMTGLLQLRTPIIFVLRAEEKVKPDAAGVPKNLGWQPIQDPRFIYEWTVSLTLHPETPGMPRYDLPHKIEGQHEHLFPEGQLIGEAAGEGLRAWARSGAAAATASGEGEKTDKGTSPTAQKGRQAAEGFVAELLEQLGTMDFEQMTRHLAGKKVKARTDRLVDAHPDLSKRIDDFVNTRMKLLDEQADAARNAPTTGTEQGKNAPKVDDKSPIAEKSSTPDPRAEGDRKFEAEIITSIGALAPAAIDSLIEQAAVASTLRRLKAERPEAHARIMAAVTARKAPVTA